MDASAAVTARGAAAAVLLLLGGLAGPAVAAERRDIDGVALGMTADQVTLVARLPCQPTATGNLACDEPGAGHGRLEVLMSGDAPPKVLTVTRTFCSTASPAAVLDGVLASYGVGAAAVRRNPNGASFDLGPTVEGNLDADEGACPTGGKAYRLFLRDTGSLRGPALSAAAP